MRSAWSIDYHVFYQLVHLIHSMVNGLGLRGGPLVVPLLRLPERIVLPSQNIPISLPDMLLLMSRCLSSAITLRPSLLPPGRDLETCHLEEYIYPR